MVEPITAPFAELGFGALRSLRAAADRYGAKRIWLVTGRSSFEKCGAAAIVADTIGDRVVGRFTEISENPTIDEVRHGVAALRGVGADLVVAIGGGAPMDFAKQVNVCAANEGDPLHYVSGAAVPTQPGLPLIACPTTAGTGSEVTPFAVCYEGLRKYSFAHPFLQPSAALIDPDLTETVPREQAASCALDALAQLIESFWAISATDESRAYSRRGIPLLLDNVHAAVNRNDRNARKALAEAAHLSGRAISIAKTTAAHAVSYPISQLWGLPHGHAVMMTLPAFVEFNAGVTEDDCAHPLGARFVHQLIQELVSLFGARDAHEAAILLDSIVHELGLHRDFARAGINGPDEIRRIVDHVNVERMRNNPRLLSADSLLNVIQVASELRAKAP